MRLSSSPAEFVRDSGANLRPLDSFALRGFVTPQTVYGLPEESEVSDNLAAIGER